MARGKAQRPGSPRRSTRTASGEPLVPGPSSIQESAPFPPPSQPSVTRAPRNAPPSLDYDDHFSPPARSESNDLIRARQASMSAQYSLGSTLTSVPSTYISGSPSYQHTFSQEYHHGYHDSSHSYRSESSTSLDYTGGITAEEPSGSGLPYTSSRSMASAPPYDEDRELSIREQGTYQNHPSRTSYSRYPDQRSLQNPQEDDESRYLSGEKAEIPKIFPAYPSQDTALRRTSRPPSPSKDPVPRTIMGIDAPIRRRPQPQPRGAARARIGRVEDQGSANVALVFNPTTSTPRPQPRAPRPQIFEEDDYLYEDSLEPLVTPRARGLTHSSTEGSSRESSVDVVEDFSKELAQFDLVSESEDENWSRVEPDEEVYETTMAIRARARLESAPHNAPALPPHTPRRAPALPTHTPRRAPALPTHTPRRAPALLTQDTQRAVAATPPRPRGRGRGRGRPQNIAPAPTGSQLPPHFQSLIPEDLPPRVAGERLGGKSNKRALDIWEFYRTDSMGQRYCLICEDEVSRGEKTVAKDYGPGSGTATLRSHLAGVHLDYWVSECARLGIVIDAKTTHETVARFQEENNLQKQIARRELFTHPRFHDHLVRFWITQNLAFRVVDTPSFRELCLLLRDSLKDDNIPHRETLRKIIMEAWVRHVHQLRADLRESVGKISLSTDGWTDITYHPFIGLIAHWVAAVRVPAGPPVLRERSEVIGFYWLPESHTGQHLANALVHVLDKYGITHKLGYVTMDNASANGTMLHHIEATLSVRPEAKAIDFTAHKNQIRCFAHCTHLSASAGCNAANQPGLALHYFDAQEGAQAHETMGVLDRARTWIRFVAPVQLRGSPLRRQRSDEEVKQFNGGKSLQLLTDSPTRWDSTDLMLGRLFVLRDPLTSLMYSTYSLEATTLCLSRGEWSLLEDVKAVLDVPREFQKQLSFERVPTLSQTLPAFAMMVAGYKKLQQTRPNLNRTPILSSALAKLEEYNEALLNLPQYNIAQIVHPFIKMRWIARYNTANVEKIKKAFVDAIAKKPLPSRDESSAPAVADRRDMPSWMRETLTDDTTQTSQRTAEEEAMSYLGDIVDPQVWTTALHFWAMRGRFLWPRVFATAMDLLPVPATSVPCERLFSSAKLVKTTLRNKLKAEMFEVCVMLKNAFHETPSLDITSQFTEESILKEMKHWTEDEEKYPRDVMDFSSTFSPLPNPPSNTHTQQRQPPPPKPQQQWQQQPGPPHQSWEQPQSQHVPLPQQQQQPPQQPPQQSWDQSIPPHRQWQPPPPPQQQWQPPPPQQQWQQPPPPQQQWQPPPSHQWQQQPPPPQQQWQQGQHRQTWQ